MSTHRALLFARGSVLLAVSAALIPSPALADLSSAQATGPDRHETDVVTDQRIVRRLVEQFLINNDGKLNFMIVVASGADLKQVMLEPPRAGRRSAIRRSHANGARRD